jgi:hypothetical protein
LVPPNSCLKEHRHDVIPFISIPPIKHGTRTSPSFPANTVMEPSYPRKNEVDPFHPSNPRTNYANTCLDSHTYISVLFCPTSCQKLGSRQSFCSSNIRQSAPEPGYVANSGQKTKRPLPYEHQFATILCPVTHVYILQ